MKASLPICFFLVFFLITFSGCRSACEIRNRAEGFDGGKLRVYVRADKSAVPVDYKSNHHNYIMILGERRAAGLLESLIITGAGDAEGKGLQKAKISDILKSARIVCEECNDDYCEAFIDYDADALKEPGSK